MKYYIKRGISEYGPYTLADLQRYVAQGNIALTDLTRSEGMPDWVPVSQVIGNMPPPAPQPPSAVPGIAVQSAGPQATPMQPGFSQTGMAYAPSAYAAQVVPGPVPTDFHWALVLVINFFCGIFRIIWQFVEAAFVKKLKPDSNFLVFMIVGKSIEVLAGALAYSIIIASAIRTPNEPPVAAFLFGAMFWLAGFAILYVGIFKMRDAMQEYYNTVEPINLRLSGVMTFFFPTFYFQHHFSRIAQWKKTGFLAPQG